MKYPILIGLLATFLFLGCVSTSTPQVSEVIKFQCANGSFSDSQEGCAAKSCLIQTCPETNCSQCPAPQVTVTQYQCLNGEVVNSLADCPIVQQPTDENLQECYVILNHSKNTNEYGWVIIAGEVKNNCSKPIQEPVYFTIYDKSGNVLSSDHTYPGEYGTPMQPGETVSFENTWTEEYVGTKFGSYKVYVKEQ